MHSCSSVASDFEPQDHQSRSRDLTTLAITTLEITKMKENNKNPARQLPRGLVRQQVGGRTLWVLSSACALNQHCSKSDITMCAFARIACSSRTGCYRFLLQVKYLPAPISLEIFFQ
ncbi:hypothetical protein AVEN_199394-1 [Araneus ventricosus]|uniref:Uncharacterized protein n=1 Tax=Araneus ventricosus TaxID=182803 RepID=A0A4Y2SQ72_ARAVE|nr:hypothetical protein AVEN_199394-1 [Araneus ventricosus]